MEQGLQSAVSSVKGIGGVRAALFEKMGIKTVEDLLFRFPRSYENFADVYKLRDAPPGKVCIKARLLSSAKIIPRPGASPLVRASATDGTDILSITYFNNPHAANGLTAGREYLFYGELKTNSKGGFEMLSPVRCPPDKGGFYHPVYRCTEGISSAVTASCVKNALKDFSGMLADAISPETQKKYRIPDIKTAISFIHFPKNEAEIINARRRLIFEELLTLSLGLRLAKTESRAPTPNTVKTDFTEEFFALLPFAPTGAQKRAVSECVSDMESGKAMRRLIQGDVGSGKTAVAAAVMYNAVKNGMQAALMAPTEVLAKQHKKTFDRFFEGTGIVTELLTGSTTQKEKARIKKNLAEGKIDLLIGTHAVITDDVVFRSLGLAVTDEQHRFGVRQRSTLGEKGAAVHTLVMSATPIPRTLSLVVYGDLDISILDEKPAGRKEVQTFRITSEKREKMYCFIKQQLDAGRQCFIVCPLAEDRSENEEIFDGDDGGKEPVNAEKYYNDISNGVFSKYKTALLYGKMNAKKKNEIMDAFSSGEIRLLVCTVVVEVGIDVPNATVMAIENAERFGLSQLHQLRGRCGRGAEKSFCILISDSYGETAEKRFETMCKTNDGFIIAEEDLKMRGPGDFFGERQSGIPELQIADLATDTRVLYAAKNEAENILNDDPALSKPENKLLRQKVIKLFASIN